MFHLTLMWFAITVAAYAVGHAHGWRRHARTVNTANQLTEKS